MVSDAHRTSRLWGQAGCTMCGHDTHMVVHRQHIAVYVQRGNLTRLTGKRQGITGWRERVLWSEGLVTPCSIHFLLEVCGHTGSFKHIYTYFYVEPAVLPCGLEGSHAMFYGSSSFAG